MSEKRFIYGETIDYNFFDVFEEKKYLGMILSDSTKIVDRLNELSEENEQLRRLFVEMKQPTTIDLTEEDEKKLRKLLGLIDDE